MLKEAKDAIKNVLDELKIADGLKYSVELPPNGIDADVSTNAAILLAKKFNKNPKDIADSIAKRLKIEKIISDARFQLGFINITFSDHFLHKEFANIIKKEKVPDKSDNFRNKKILIEFVSANPTGPLHIGHGRGAAFGDTLARLLEFLGAEVKREYYINDVGNQMQILAESVLSYISKKPLPENGYEGKYIEDIAKQVSEIEPKIASSEIGSYTMNKILDWIKNDLEKFGVTFNSWFRESELYKSSEVDDTINELKEKKLAYEKDGAVWFKSTDFADDKDRVLVRADGRKTYLASDIAYHINKYQRNYAEYIDIWGADHHGYVERVRGAVRAVGCDEKKLKIILYQLVNIIKDGKKVNMSTRSGEFITLKEVIDEVGVDATRFFLLMRNSESHLDFDLDLAKKQAPENPVFYVQYAHARICSIFKEAEKTTGVWNLDAVNLKKLVLKEERELIKRVLYFADLLEIAARDYAPNYITKYLQDIASCFHSYYNKNRVITEDIGLSGARMAMCQAVRNVIKDGLNILGVSAPEKM